MGYSALGQELILPTVEKETVRLNISRLSNLSSAKLAYEYLAVFVENEREEYDVNPVQGRYSMEDDYLVFSPYFPFERGMVYVVRTKHPDTDGSYTYQSFQIEDKQTVDQAKVLSIYPSANELPENLLRFYVYFNTPMRKGQALKYIQLTDATGNIDAYAFMEFKQELWSPDGKRLTILFDPGRIKRGVSTNLELGPALHQGQRYHLTLSGAWQDVYGQKLLVDTTKEFVVGKAYRHCIEVNEWEIHKPRANSHDTLGIQFDRVMDHALVQSMIQIEDEEKERIAGHWEILEQEQLIQFIPEKTWQKARYRIVIDKRLEDVAGNNLYSPLDQNVTDIEDNRNTHQAIYRFEV